MAVIKLTKENFEEETSGSKILVDFWAPWCSPCNMLTPVIDEIEKELGDTVKVGKVNVDDEPELAIEFGAMSIPTLVVIENRKVINSSVGVIPKQDIIELLDL